MNTSRQSQIMTHMFARVLGPFYVIVPVIAAVRAPERRTLPLSDFGIWPWATGAFLLMTGLVIIAFHQYWRSVAAFVVSLLGWVMVLRGFFILAFPSVVASTADSVMGESALWQAVDICVAVIGLYLTYVGWVAVAIRSASHADSSIPDLPRAE